MTGSRKYSDDLEQGGLEIPCVLIFKGSAKVTTKAKKLVESALATEATSIQASKKRKTDNYDFPVTVSSVATSEGQSGSDSTNTWATLKGFTREDQHHIESGKKLNDLLINIAQEILKKQFPDIRGLNNTLLQKKKSLKRQTDTQKIQIIHSRGDHWIVASTTFAEEGEVKVYDSVYRTLDQGTKDIISNLFESESHVLAPTSKQTGGQDCGVYAIAMSTALDYENPTVLKFDQPSLRPHLIMCIEKGEFSLIISNCLTSMHWSSLLHV